MPMMMMIDADDDDDDDDDDSDDDNDDDDSDDDNDDDDDDDGEDDDDDGDDDVGGGEEEKENGRIMIKQNKDDGGDEGQFHKFFLLCRRKTRSDFLEPFCASTIPCAAMIRSLIFCVTPASVVGALEIAESCPSPLHWHHTSQASAEHQVTPCASC